ncbi:winged helix-turn-helix domain-containing protein [Photobacterium damselae]|uniref:winged helix-turn-helix domain-containing protein n=1 Tax=Photobacterium damselae TaxID=38293 RepID=UPI001EFD13E4|nr:transcriptional regulator [Photobacterium damselae]MCG9703712.1 transcriptional regulator [Photobacterium damselae]
MHKTSAKHCIGQRFIFDPYDNSLIDTVENNELIRLGSNESRALSLLIDEPGAIITRNRLHDYVWREQGFEVDDSSLTQCISTLRKALKDPTKSPEYVKTVPKRGYQMIATVEKYVDMPLAITATEHAEDLTSVPEHHYQDSALVTAPQSAVEVELSNIQQPQQQPISTEPVQQKSSAKVTGSRSLLSIIALILALLIPQASYFAPAKASDNFIPLFSVKGVQVVTPNNNPIMNDWQSLISTCITSYLDNHQQESKPVKVIVTGGQSNQVWLNYIHTAQTANENVTLRLLTSHEDNANLCR